MGIIQMMLRSGNSGSEVEDLSCDGAITFVVLHYETIEDTKECVQSIRNLDGPRPNIVVVDNGSPAGKLDLSTMDFLRGDDITLLLEKKNLGFAKGNNVGFLYAKEVLQSKVIILANNDLIFKDRLFLIGLIREYSQEQFDVAGPKITSLVDGLNQNPVPRMYTTRADVISRMRKKQALLLLSYFRLDVVFQKAFSQKRSLSYECIREESEYQLHGACLILSNRFIRERDGLHPGTFMYGEEEILRFEIERDGMKMRYLDGIEVCHKEGSSTKKHLGNGVAKRRFYYRSGIAGCKLLIRLMDNTSISWQWEK